MHQELADFKEYFSEAYPTGSKFICNPPVLDTDEDWVVYTEEPKLFHSELHKEGYTTSQYYYRRLGTAFKAFRSPHSNLNLIITPHKAWYDRFVEATDIAKSENLRDKTERVRLFELVLRGWDKKPKTQAPESVFKPKVFSELFYEMYDIRNVQTLPADTTVFNVRDLWNQLGN